MQNVRHDRIEGVDLAWDEERRLLWLRPGTDARASLESARRVRDALRALTAGGPYGLVADCAPLRELNLMTQLEWIDHFRGERDRVRIALLHVPLPLEFILRSAAAAVGAPVRLFRAPAEAERWAAAGAPTQRPLSS